MNKKHTISFKLKYLVYVMFLICLALLAIAYVWTLLKDYENSQPERKVEYIIDEMKAYADEGTLWNKYKFPTLEANPYETTPVKNVYMNELADGEVSYKLKPGAYGETTLVYSIVSDDGYTIADVKLEADGEPVTKLAVFTIQKWIVDSVIFIAEAKNYTIDTPENFTVTVNGIELDKLSADQLGDGNVRYTIENIVIKPDVVITDLDGNVASYKTSGTRIKTEYYAYSLTLPASLTVYLNGEVHEGTLLDDGSVSHEIRALSMPEVRIEDLMGNSVDYTGGHSIPLTYCKVIAYDDMKITINGVAAPESMISPYVNTALEPLTEFVENLPSTVIYDIAVLQNDAMIVATDKEDSSLFVNAKNGTVDITSMKSGASVPEDIAAQIDVLATAKKWSLFMSKDLTGNNYGFWDLANSLVKDSYLYNVAYKYATGIDITFTSIHTLKNPPFVNETVDNFKWITEDCFAVDIGFDKQMVLGDGRELTDTMYSTFYFINNEKTGNTWKLILIKEIVE